MGCALEKALKADHDKIKDERYKTITHMCPVLDRQICLWCCLHICDVADPRTRVRASENFPAYAEKVPELSARELDSIFETCSRCHVRRT